MNNFKTINITNTKNQSVDIEYCPRKGFYTDLVLVSFEDYNYPIGHADRCSSYRLRTHHFSKLSSYKSIASLIKYAKANCLTDEQINDPINKESTFKVERPVTPCPVPAPAPAKSAAKGQGISVPPAEFDIDKAISEFSRSYLKGGDSFLRFESIPPVNGMELPSNLE